MRHRTLIANRARALRKAMSEPEVMLWSRLRGRGPDRLLFRRQHPMGSLILDFYCAAAKLAVEVDGSTHWDDDARDRDRDRDEARDSWLRGQGLEVLRIPASRIYADFTGVVDAILRTAEARTAEIEGAQPAPSTTRSEPVLGPACGRTRGAGGPPPPPPPRWGR